MANSTVNKQNGDSLSGDEVMDIVNAIATKVDKDGSKVLSDVNFSTAKDAKLNGIASGATAVTIANNLTTTVAGQAGDATQLKALNDLITAIKGGSSTSISTLATQLATLNTIVTDTTPDGGTLISTIQELLSVFSDYPEGASVASALALKAPLASPALTGTPTAPTATTGTNTTQLATTAFVAAAVGGIASPVPIVETITTGSSIALANATTRLIINPATSSTISSLAVTLPATPTNGQHVRIYCGGTVTSGTVVASMTVTASQGIVQAPAFAPTDAQYGDTYTYEYLSSTSKWYLV